MVGALDIIAIPKVDHMWQQDHISYVNCMCVIWTCLVFRPCLYLHMNLVLEEEWRVDQTQPEFSQYWTAHSDSKIQVLVT